MFCTEEDPEGRLTSFLGPSFDAAGAGLKLNGFTAEEQEGPEGREECEGAREGGGGGAREDVLAIFAVLAEGVAFPSTKSIYRCLSSVSTSTIAPLRNGSLCVEKEITLLLYLNNKFTNLVPLMDSLIFL